MNSAPTAARDQAATPGMHLTRRHGQGLAFTALLAMIRTDLTDGDT
ncbi:MAG: hypothetical protein WAZ94_12535 [Phycisphaerales bacterium]